MARNAKALIELSAELALFKVTVAEALLRYEQSCARHQGQARMLATIEIIKLGATMHLAFGGCTESFLRAARELRLEVENESPLTHH